MSLIKIRTERTEKPFLTATASGKGLGSLPLGSPQSRAAARALANVRQESESDPDAAKWDCSGLAETIAAARRRADEARAGGLPLERDSQPLPGKPKPGSLAERTTQARERLRRFEEEKGGECEAR